MGKQLQDEGTSVEANQFYDQVMEAIDPELTTQSLSRHEREHGDLPSDDESDRAKRYAQSFDRFDRISSLIMNSHRILSSRHDRHARSVDEHRSDTADRSRLEQIQTELLESRPE